METRFEAGRLYGTYRCRKYNSIMSKIPRLTEETELPNVAEIVISGILNFGNNPRMIRMMAQECLCTDKVVIPYDKLNFAKTIFVREIIEKKLAGTLSFSVENLVRTFYEFLESPTEMTKEMQISSDVQDIERYLNCEDRIPVPNIGSQSINLCDNEFICRPDLFFNSIKTIQYNKHKEGRKTVYNEKEMRVIECVRVFTGKPQVKESSKILDKGVSTRLELYLLLKTAEKIMKEKEIKADVPILLKASYYYLQKERETKYNFDFWDKGGNVVSLSSTPEGMGGIDSLYGPLIREFIEGSEVEDDICQKCSVRSICKKDSSPIPLSENEKKKAMVLPRLSMEQKKAANELNGNIRVIATAGSGKTTTMAYRIMNLLKSGVKPEKIACLTFTNAGANEMKDRIKGFCEIAGIKANVDKITISTIHSFGDELLKKYYDVLGYSKSPILINEIQKTKIIEKILSEHKPIPGLEDKYKNFYMDMFRVKGILETMKDYFTEIQEGINIFRFEKTHALDKSTVELILQMYKEYSDYKMQACLIEHSDQETGVLKLLEAKPNLFDEVGFEHISVDEYQDTSNIQFEIINAMRKAKCTKSLFIVGDDDQSIYGFRDANVKLIQDFFSMIEEEGNDIKLMENRRSTCAIVDFADKLISFNKQRVSKHPVSVNEEGRPVSVVSFNDKEEEQKYIVDSVVSKLKEGWKENDIAILAPTNAELLDYAVLLRDKGVETVSINPEPILENKKVKGAIAFIKFLNNHSGFHAMTYLDALKDTSDMSSDDLEKETKKLLEAIASVDTVADLFSWFNSLDENKEDEIYQEFLDDIITTQEEAIASGMLTTIYEYILDYERFAKKQTARREKTYNGVVLSTMHSSKGKEWPVVFLSISKLHTRTMEKKEIPEKNRLLFVACTRAKKELYISSTDIAFSSVQTGPVENMFLRECFSVKSE